MLTEYDIYLCAAARGWSASIELLHADEYIRGVFLSRGQQSYLLGPLGAVQSMTSEQLLLHLEDPTCETKGLS